MEALRVRAAIYDYNKLALLYMGVEKELKKRGVKKRRAVPPKVVLPLLEAATMENEKSLQTMWAKLLATAMDASAEVIHRQHVAVLQELSGRNAKYLELMFAEWLYWEKQERSEKGDRYESGVGGSGGKKDTSVFLFYRLGLIVPVIVGVKQYEKTSKNTYIEGTEIIRVFSDLEVVVFTEFGEQFCMAIMGDVSTKYRPPDWSKG